MHDARGPARRCASDFTFRCRTVRDGAAHDRRTRGAPHLFDRDRPGQRRRCASACASSSGGRMSRELATQMQPRRRARCRHADRPVSHGGRSRRAQRSYVAFAAGSGITPVLSLATDILAREPEQPLHADLRQPQHGAHHVPGGHARARRIAISADFRVHFVMSREPQQTALLNGRIDAAQSCAIWRRR